MHILTLDEATDVAVSVSQKAPPPVFIHSCRLEEKVNGNTDYFIPAITTDGRILLLDAGKTEDLERFQQAVSDRLSVRFASLPKGIHDISIGNFAVVGVAFHFPDISDVRFIVFETLVFTQPLPELEQIYSLVKAHTAGDGVTRLQIESYFAGGQPKNWINGVIDGWRQRLDWDNYVDTQVKKWKRDNK